MPRPMHPAIRFFSGYTRSADGCWIWNGYTRPGRYGLIKVYGKMISAHRFSYLLHFGPLPEGDEVMHRCDTPACVNPCHLLRGSHLENMRDMGAKGRRVKGRQNPRIGDRNRQSKAVIVDGQRYGSIGEAARAAGVSKGTIQNWLKSQKARYQDGQIT